MTVSESELSGLGLEVEVGSIEAELKLLWEADDASTKASLINLAVYSERAGALLENSSAIQSLTREHACRALLIGMDREAVEASLRSWITAHCHLAQGKKSVCCEQVSFLMAGRVMGRLRNTVFAHLASDLPLVFWWQGELSDLFEPDLYRQIDRFVFDSSSWGDLQAGFGRIKAAADDSQGRIVMQDLSWTRSYHFRLAVAALFDDPMAQESLASISNVLLQAAPDQRPAALLLLSWLATQGGWEISGCEEREGSTALQMSAGEWGVEALIKWRESPFALQELNLKSSACEVAVVREGEHLMQRVCDGEHRLDLRCPADPVEAVDLVADQLSRGGKNALLRKVWPTFFKLLEIS